MKVCVLVVGGFEVDNAAAAAAVVVVVVVILLSINRYFTIYY